MIFVPVHEVRFAVRAIDDAQNLGCNGIERKDSLLVLNKVDLLEHTDFDMEVFLRDFRGLNTRAPLIEVSCRTGQGIEDFAEWVAGSIERHRQGAGVSQ